MTDKLIGTDLPEEEINRQYANTVNFVAAIARTKKEAVLLTLKILEKAFARLEATQLDTARQLLLARIAAIEAQKAPK